MASELSSSRILCEKILDDRLVRKVCFGGVEDRYRALAWRVVFQTVSLRRDQHQQEIMSRNDKYLMLAAGYGGGPDSGVGSMPQVLDRGEYRSRARVSRKTMHQIDIDIKRIDSRHRTHLGTDISYMYRHILLLVAHRRPALGYVQGMADILVPFILVFSQENLETAESSSYFCYSRLLDEIQHNIVGLQTGMIRRLDKSIEIAAPELRRHLRDIGLEMHMFAFRWFNCFFIREFKFPAVYKILDTIFASDSINELLLYFGVALVMNFKPVLIENDFSHNILFLQNMYEREWEDAEIELLLSSARFYRSAIHGRLQLPTS